MQRDFEQTSKIVDFISKNYEVLYSLICLQICDKCDSANSYLWLIKTRVKCKNISTLKRNIYNESRTEGKLWKSYKSISILNANLKIICLSAKY